MKNRQVCSAGLVYLYLIGKVAQDEIDLQHVDSYTCPMDCFDQRVDDIRSQIAEHADVEVFCILGVHEKIDVIAEVISDEIQKSFCCAVNGKKYRFTGRNLDASGNIFARMVQKFMISEDVLRFPRSSRIDEGEWGIHWFWGGRDGNKTARQYVEDVIEVWMSYERPVLFGKQLMIQSFLLRDLIGRRITDILPVSDAGSLGLLLEGGLNLRLYDDMPYCREKFHSDLFAVAEIDTILLNPVYAYGTGYTPTELCEEWHKVFLYAAALADVSWDMANLVPVYENFLCFLECNICEIISADRIIDKKVYLEVLIRTIEQVRSFMRGKEEVVISRDMLMLMNSRYIYLPYLFELFKIQFPHMNNCESKMGKFQIETLRAYIASSEIGGANEKGRQWENAAEYVMAQIKGLAVSGKRVRVGTQEIDLSMVNVSQDGELWEMGAYILVECKNWKRKAGVPVIRNLGHICSLKGNKTAVLFAANGVTADAQKEVQRLAQHGIYILCISRDEMMDLHSGQSCRDLIQMKWESRPEPIR